ncbi:MAG: response regulator [Alphaproteobacteria bacterium]
MAYNFQHIKILLVEDNPQMLMLLKSVLQSFGVGTIETSLDGNDAFEKFCILNPDLVITDWLMSPCDGISFSRKVRNDPKSPNQYVPIILMTGFSEKKRVLSARDVGITEFLVKPFNTRDLYKRLFQIIEKPRQFIRCEDFFGPDRRRKSKDDYAGPMRRETDNSKSTMADVPVTDIDFL